MDRHTWPPVFRTFWRQCGARLLPPLVADLAITGILLPVFRWLTPRILERGAVPLVSRGNLAWLAGHHPGVLLALLGELVVVVGLLVTLMIVTLVGIGLAQGGRLTGKQWLRASWAALRAQRPGGLLVWLPLLLLLAPLVSLVFRTPLFIQVRLPAIMADFLPRHAWLLGLAILAFALLIWLLARLIPAVPGLLTPGESPQRVLTAAWHGRPAWTPLYRWMVLLVGLAALAWGTTGLLLGLQLLADRLPGPWPLDISRVILTLAQVVNAGLLATGVALGTLVAWSGEQSVTAGPRSGRRDGVALGLALAAIAVLATRNAVSLLPSARPARPIVIAHRGVDDHNGVQNTLPVLVRTHSNAHPAFVELDVHETRDRRFVVVHDETLQKLAQRDAAPGQLTLGELTRLTARENGQAARIVSFDHYLAAAEACHQPLLVEVKTSKFDRPGMLARFSARYGHRLAKDHDRVHSLNYAAVRELARRMPAVPVFYIEPYDPGQPNPGAAGYSMEHSSLSPAFIAATHQTGRPVYAWTVNQSGVMERMAAMGVDGVITDRAGLANRVLRRASYDSLARRLFLILTN